MERWNHAKSAILIIALIATSAISPATGRTPKHTVVDHSKRVQRGVASIYSRRTSGKTTASGTPLAPNKMTAASPTLPLGTRAKVTNKKTGKSAQVTITDRGPYAKGRVLDVTPKAAQQLGIKEAEGVAPVEIKPVAEPTGTR
jgi:rare lipoprotein A